jgi:hypothetical protein
MHRDLPPNWKEVFLRALADVPVVGHACKAADVSRTMVYTTRKDDPSFAQDWDNALEEGIDKGEIELHRRAVKGFQEPVIDKGRICYIYKRSEDGNFVPVLDDNGQPIPLTVTKHSDTLLQFMLRGRRRDPYGDRTEITGAGGGPITTLDETAKAARLAALLEIAKTRKDLG